MRRKSTIGVVLSAMLLAGCSFGGLVGGAAPATYDLDAPSVKQSHGKRAIQLTINTPVAIKTIDTEEILVKSPNGRVAYFSGAAWGDRLPRLFQARLVEAFANTGGFRAILTNQDRVLGEMSLAIEIRDFQVEAAGGKTEAVIDVYAKLVSERSNAVVTTKRFLERTRASSEDVSGGVQALNVAFQKVALDIVAWVIQSGGQV